MENSPELVEQPVKPKYKLRWYQYSLRSLLIVTTLFAIICSITVYYIRLRGQAITELRKVGAEIRCVENISGKISFLRKCGISLFGEECFLEVRAVRLKDLKVGDEVMPFIGRLKELHEIGLERTNVSDTGLAQLRSLEKLEFLMLTETSIGDAGVKHICSLPNLWHLNLGGTRITDASIPDLAKMPKLTQLMLTAVDITDIGLGQIESFKNLKQLYLNGSKVTDEGLVHLKKLPKLEAIGLYDTAITDSGVKYLAEILSLREINLQRTQITDVALEDLDKLPNIERLDLSVTKVSKPAIAKFTIKHPKCKIESYGNE
jgi:internalin A